MAMPHPDAPGATSSHRRVASVDVVRGLAMVFMALDHVRDYVSRDHFPPENLARGTAALFATRWVTHFCAPAFFLLAGVGIGLSRPRAASDGALRRFLVTRGLWLVVLDIIITPLFWQFGPPPVPALALTLWALGWSMIGVALIMALDVRAIAVLAVAMIAGHNLLDGISADRLGALAGIWNFLHGPGFAIPGLVFVVYPLIPWIGVMMLGYALASLYREAPERRRKVLLVAGISATVLFILLRATNGYGNPRPWEVQRTTALTVASFLNVTKQPPSLQFLTMTLGPILVLLALTENARGRIAEWLSVYGRVPLFYYVVHIIVAHLVALPLPFIQGGEWLRLPVLTSIDSFPEWYGVGLPGVYAFWVLVVVLLYQPCRWWGRLKATRDDWWVRYL